MPTAFVAALAALPRHDRSSRVLLCCQDGWEIRQYAESDARLASCAARGSLHLQLVNEEVGISILSPSLLTCGRWEVWVPAEGRFALRNLDDVNLCVTDRGAPSLNGTRLLPLIAEHIARMRRRLRGTGRPRRSGPRSPR